MPRKSFFNESCEPVFQLREVLEQLALSILVLDVQLQKLLLAAELELFKLLDSVQDLRVLDVCLLSEWIRHLGLHLGGVRLNYVGGCIRRFNER